MKKILICCSCIIAIILISGCSMDNTPTKKVEKFLDNYKNHDETVITQLKEMVDSDSLMDENQKTNYVDIMKKQYQDLTYDIKDEVIDGDKATVTAEIEVYDYYKINQDAQDYYDNNSNEFESDKEEGIIEKAQEKTEEIIEGAKDEIEQAKEEITGEERFVEYRLNKLKDAKERVKYTIDFTLTKVDNIWTLNEIDDTTRQKIHGLYEH